MNGYHSHGIVLIVELWSPAIKTHKEPLTLFDDPEEIAKRDEDEAREKRMQRAMLDIKNRFGPNAILKGTSYQDAATGIERNKSIGGHHE